MKTPCHHCIERSPTCHGSCERYAEFAEGRKEVYRQREQDCEDRYGVNRMMNKKIKELQRTRRR